MLVHIRQVEQILVNLVRQVDIIQLVVDHLVTIAALATTVQEVVLEQHAELVLIHFRLLPMMIVCVVIVAQATTVQEV